MTPARRGGKGGDERPAPRSAPTATPPRAEPAPAGGTRPELAGEVDRLVAGEHPDPHLILGAHPAGGAVVVRAYHPTAERCAVAHLGGVAEMERVNPRGLFETTIPVAELPRYRLRFGHGDRDWEVDDPYRFWPTLGELDLHLIGEGRHHRLWERLGARVIEHQGVTGTAFAVWAPSARAVSLVSDAGFWDDRIHPMRSLGSSGVWELFLPDVGAGTRYKYRILGADGRRTLRADPLARRAEEPPATASIVDQPLHTWTDGVWLEHRSATVPATAPMSIYEVHLGSWRRHPEDGDRPLSYLEAGEQLADYCAELGFTHVEFLPLANHPFAPSWGYQVTGYYAPAPQFGSPDQLRAMIDTLHRRGIGVILDWVPAHFPRDEWALARFDGTALYEHADPRQGAHPDWGTLIFNYGRNEVRNFLLANARYWVEEFHIDGLRVDAVASMLYLDYSRQPGEWIPNPFGGRENLEAVNFLREMTETVRHEFPGVVTVAEESTAWPGVTRPAATGGLGFSFKWNMGWMHDTLDYFHNDPIFRRYHHGRLTFGLWYAWSERFVLPLSHDEVVHGKGSLLGKMPGDSWQRFANLRALLAWMWAHPGKQLLFMGGEIGQEREWSESRSLDWHLLGLPEHAGLQRLVRDLNSRYGETPALFEWDDRPEGFEWIDAGNADQNVASFVRRDSHGHPGLACVANFSPVVHHAFRVGLPQPGWWSELLNSDAGEYGGSGVGNLGGVEAEERGWNGQPCSAVLTLPPLSVIWLGPRA